MRIRTRSIIIMLSRALTQATTIALAMILVRMVGQTESGRTVIGTYDQILVVFAFFVAIAGLPLENSLYYYLPKLGKEQRGTLLLQTLLGSLGMGALIGAAMFLLSDYVGGLFPTFKDLPSLIRIFSLYPFVDRLHALLPAFMINHDRTVRAMAYSFAISVSRALTVVGLLAMGFGLATVLWAVVAVGAVIAIVGCIDMARMCPGRWRFDKRLLLDQFHYAWPLWATMIASILNVQFDKLLISHNFDPAVLAVYTRGALELPVVGMIAISLNTAIMPELVTLTHQGRKAESLVLCHEATRKASLVIFPCFVFFLAIAPDFMVLLYTEAFRTAAWPFGIFLFMLPLRGAVYGMLFRAMGWTRVIAISAALGLLVNVVVGSTLTYAGGKTFLSFVGPSVGTVVSAFLMCGYELWRLTKLTGVPFGKVMRWKELGVLFLLSTTCGLFIAVVPLPGLPLLAKLAAQGVLFMASFAFMLWWTRILNPDERRLMLLPLGLVSRLLRRCPTAAE